MEILKNKRERESSLLSSLKAKLEAIETFELGSRCCIYKVPPKIRKVNEEAYTPTAVSIGPFHFGDKRLESMEEVKLWCLNNFLKRNKEKLLADYIKALRDWEDEIRRSYLSCFNGRFSILEIAFNFFRRVFLHHIVVKKDIRAKCTFNHFQHYLEQTITTQFEPSKSKKAILHLNDMLRIFYLPNPLPKREFGKLKPVYTANQLRGAGIKFRVNEQFNYITDLKYTKGVLKIPYFQVCDWTEIVMRNIVAFEQCHLALESYVTDYVTLLNYLIDTGKDVELLVEKGIMDNLLGSNDEVASLINTIDKNCVFMTSNSEYLSLCEELNKFYENPYHKYKAIFKHEYLSTPWRIASFIAAILLLVLTLVQTFFSLPFSET